MKEAGGISFGDSVKDFARKCKGKQGRARLAAAVGVLAMLLILLSELFRRTRQRAAQKHKVCPEQHGISGTAGEPAGTSDLTDERCGQNDRDGHAGDWGRSHLCAGYTVRRNAVPADPCSAGRWFSLDRNGMSAAGVRCGRAVRGRRRHPRCCPDHRTGKRTAGSAIQPHLCGTAQGLRPCSFYKEERFMRALSRNTRRATAVHWLPHW